VGNAVTRRAWIAALPAAVAAGTASKRPKPLPAPGEFVAFIDPTTEARVVRLTHPAHTSLLPAAPNRFISIRERFLLFSSDRHGSPAPYRMDLRTGIPQQLAESSGLVPESLWLDEKDRSLHLIEGKTLREIALQTRKVRTVAEDVSAFALVPGGRFILVRGGSLQWLDDTRPIADHVAPFCLMRPDGKGCLFLRESSPLDREFWYAPLAAAGHGKPVLLAKGAVSNPFWSPAGSLLFLRDLHHADTLFSEIREVNADTAAEACVAPTSQFAAFAPNADASVFVGASRSHAQPTVMLLLRSVNRELTLCEHKSSKPASVSPVFSPDSRRVYFQSDHQGKPALYSVNVESLVEPTTPAL
jgi:oligogalacturonide lyase